MVVPVIIKHCQSSGSVTGKENSVELCVYCNVPWVGLAAGRSGSSPEPGGGGRWAELPLGPCGSPPAAVARWLPPAPAPPPSPGNAARAHTHTQNATYGAIKGQRKSCVACYMSKICMSYLDDSFLVGAWKILGLPLSFLPFSHHLSTRWGRKNIN